MTTTTRRALSIFEAAGGAAAFQRLAAAHHQRCLVDPVLNHPFSHPGHPQHVERLAAYWAEIFGGPPTYTRAAGDHSFMLELHARTQAEENLGRRFLACFVASFDDAGLPADAELRSALRAYMDWAVGDVMRFAPADAVVPAERAVPRWTWDGLEDPILRRRDPMANTGTAPRCDETPAPRRTCTSRVIKASPETLYRALTDPAALVVWRVPGEMTATIHHVDVRVGGGYQMSLYYPLSDTTSVGKTADKEDRYMARFVELVPPTRIVEALTFASDDAAFAGEMLMEVTLVAATEGTTVTITFTAIPVGIRPEDNEAGTRSALEKLARYVEG